MKANFKPTLLASVIAAVIYTPNVSADECALVYNYPFQKTGTFSPNTTSDKCLFEITSDSVQGASISLGGNAATVFQSPTLGATTPDGAKVEINRASNPVALRGDKGVVTVAGTTNVALTFGDTLTVDYTEIANDEGLRILLNRHKSNRSGHPIGSIDDVIIENSGIGGIALNGNNNNITVTANEGTNKTDPETVQIKGHYAGAAISNYSNFRASNPDINTFYNTEISNTGNISGINQYNGYLIFDQNLTIKSNISHKFAQGTKPVPEGSDKSHPYPAPPSEQTQNPRRLAGILLAGGNGARFNNVTVNEKNKGAGIVATSYYSAATLDTWVPAKPVNLINGTLKSDFNGVLNVTTKDGSGIVLTAGGINHTKKDTDLSDQKKATITVNGKGHGIEVPADAGVLGDHTTTSPSYSEFNFVSLAGGTIDKGEHKLAIGLGENATITTTDKDSDGINIANVPEGNINTIVIHNKGKIHAKGSDADAIDLSALTPSAGNEKNPDLDGARKITITNDKGSLLADSGYLLKGSAYNETFKSTDGELKGKIGMGDGSDNVTITGSDISGVTLFDGGDDTNTKDTWIDILNLNGVTYTNSGSNISNWENINLGNQTTLNLTGTLITGKGDETGVPTQSTGLTINNGARLNVGTDAAPDVTIEGKVTNSGTIDLSANDPKPVQKLTIKGDYTGNNGTIIFDGLLKDDVNSKADSLTIEGNTDGKTNVVVKPTNPGDTGGATNQGIKLISVGGNSNQSHFTLQNPVQLTAYEYNILHYNPSNKVFFLQSKKNPSGGKKPVEGGKPKPAGSGNSNNANTTHSNTAYKPVDKPSKKIPDSVDTTPIPDVNNGNGNGSYKPELYRPAVATYSMVQFSNQDAINSLLGDQLHQRVGEQEVLRWDDKEAHDNQVWGRIRHNQLKLNGKKQFEVKQNTQLVQFGWDLDVHRNDQNSRQHSGLFAGFARANAEVSDRDRAFTEYGAFSGKVKGDIFNIGAYHTRYDEQGNYLDVIGGVHFVGNQYNDVYGSSSKQRGWGLSASVEGGMPFAIGDSEHWFVEPQAQLSWQMTQYKKFDDAVTSIDGYTSQSLRPRLGVRVGYNDKSANPEQRSKDFYATASFVRELLDPAKVNIGGVNVTEKVNNDTWVEVGLGGQLPIGKSTYIYGSAQYQHTIGSDARSGVNGQIGVRYSW